MYSSLYGERFPHKTRPHLGLLFKLRLKGKKKNWHKRCCSGDRLVAHCLFCWPVLRAAIEEPFGRRKGRARPAYHGQFAFSIRFRCLFFSMRWIERRQREREAVCVALSSITKQKESSQRRERGKVPALQISVSVWNPTIIEIYWTFPCLRPEFVRPILRVRFGRHHQSSRSTGDLRPVDIVLNHFTL